MGCSESQQAVLDHEGKVVMNRRCIVLLSPPSFQTSKFIEAKPEYLNYRYISVGKLIRDQINKRTHYSKIIMENLAKFKKINDKILEVLLKNIALQGNFIIQFCPKDNEDLDIWRKFLKQVDVQMVAIIKPDQKTDAGQQKLIFEDKMKSYNRDVKSIKQMFSPQIINVLTNEGDNVGEIWDEIMQKMKNSKNKGQDGK